MTVQTNKLTAYGTIASVLTTELNALVTDATAISGALDNSSANNLFDDLELFVSYSVAPSARATVDVYLLPSIDDTNYSTNPSSPTAPSPQYHVGSFGLLAQTGNQYASIRGIPLPPGLFKYVVQNKAGQTMGATSNTVKRRSYNLQSI